MNIHKSIVILLLTLCWSALSYGQDCVSFTGPITLPQRIDTSFLLPIYNLDSTDLATNQRVCRVNIDFATEYPEDMLFAIVAPNGEEMVLTGQTGVRSVSALPFTNWDISFVPLSVTPMPDAGYDNTWANGNLWSFFTTYTGSYWPYDGVDLDNLRTGPAYGVWKLRVIDFLDLHSVTINSFSIEFCNAGGIDCKECEAEADTLNPTIIKYCENDPIKRFEFSDYLNDTMHLDNLPVGFTYQAVIARNDTVIHYRDAQPLLDLNGLASGTYQVYGMAYDDAYMMDVPNPDSTFTIDSLRTMIDSLPRIFCGDLTTEALTIIIDPIDTTYITTAICNGDSLVVGDNIFRESIMTQVNLINQNDCDSIVIVDLEVISIPLTVIDTTLCAGDSLSFNEAWFTERTNQPFRFTSSNQGCDSTVLLDLKFHPYNFREIVREICGGDDFSFFGNDLNMTGVYRDSVIGANGCDSVVLLNLNVVTEFIVDTVTSLCIGDTFLIDTEKYFATGMYTHTFPSTLGCDSTVNLDLTIVEPIINDISEIICFGDSVSVGVKYYKDTGEYSDTLMSSIGCDSIVNLELIVRQQNTSTTIETICFGDSIQSAGRYYKTAGIHRDTLIDQFLCDSIVILDLSIREENRVAISDVVCFGGEVMVGDSTYSSTGFFETVLQGVNGCDSIVTLDLVVEDQVISILDSTICRGDSILVGGDYFNTAGSFAVTIPRVGDCDSTVMVDLNIIEPIISVLPVRRCQGEPYTLGNATYTTAGIYRDTFQSMVTGCDSIVILDLQYDPTYLIESFESKCAGDSSFFDNRWIKETGIYDDTLRTVANCDSIARLHLTFFSLDDPVMLFETLCFGDSLLFDGVYLKEDGVYRDTLISSQFCDSLVIMDLSFRAEQSVVDARTICLGDTISFGNDLFFETGMYPFTYLDQYGCDSTIVLDLTVEVCALEIEIDPSNPTCAGISNGVIHFSLDYGEPPYAYDLYDISLPGGGAIRSGIIETFGGADTLMDLSSGQYELFISSAGSAGGAVESFMITLTNESGININTTESLNPTCIDASDGIITNQITGGFEPYTYLWNDGGEELSRSGLTADDYQLIVTDNLGCMDTFDFVLTNPNPISFQIEQTPPSCAGETDAVIQFIDVVGGAGNYVYDIGLGPQSEPLFSSLSSDTYMLTVEDANGCVADGVEVINDPAVFSINLGEDLTVDNIGDVQLNLSASSPMARITWNPSEGLSCDDCPNPIASITNTTTYRVSAESEFGCVAQDQITIILDIDRTVDPAQAFTPNADGVNDVFIVHGNSSIAEISNIEVYARSGELVWKQESFPVNDPNFGWDGTYQGEPMTSQIFAYFIEVIYTDGKTKLFKGQLALIR